MAFATGFLGSGHCLGMCGGLVAAFSLAGRRPAGPLFHLLYNLGRTLTYTTAGLVAGWFGSALAYTQNFAWFTRTALVFSDLFVIGMGLATALALPRLNIMAFEGRGPVGWLSRGAGRLVRLPSPVAALPLGLLMGFLPCGFLYAMLLTAAGTTAPLAGSGVMLAFGLGTAPALLVFGSAAGWLSDKLRGRLLRGAGLLVALMGLAGLFRHLELASWILAAVPFTTFCCPLP